MLLLSSSTACVQRRHIGAPLTIVPDSSVYRYAPDPREPGAYRVRLTVRLRNHSADTVYLAGPCGASGRPAQWFLAADRDEEVALALWACIGAVARPLNAPAPAYFAIPPRGERTDTTWIFARPRPPPAASTIPWSQYAGDFRIAYVRMERRGWPRAQWRARPRRHTVSPPFRLVAPDA